MKDAEKEEIRQLIAEFEAAKATSKSPSKTGKTGKTGKAGTKGSKGGGSSTTVKTQLVGSPTKTSG